MIYEGLTAWMLLCYQVTCRPLSSEILKEDEKVTRCIVEVISDTLSKPNPLPLSNECSKILKEDERVLAMVHHQNLLRELEELTHHGESSAQQKPLKSDKKWNYPTAESVEWKEQGNLEKRLVSLKKDGRDERRDNLNSQGGSNVKKNIPSKEEGDMKKYEKSKGVNMEEEHKDKEIINGEDDTKVVMHASQEEVGDEDKGSSEKRQSESSEEDQSSNELGQEERDLLKIDELIEKIAKQELESREVKQGEKKHWSKEKDDVDRRDDHGQTSVKKRVQENASDEETGQFEAEQKGLKILETQTHLQGTSDKHSLEQEVGEGKRHHRFDVDLKKRREGDTEQLWKRQRDLENGKEEEEGEGEEEEGEEERKLRHEEHELRNLAEIEKELKEVAEKLRDIRRG
ncbi:chromogranin-A-like [Pristis pectinata]|uniref:chromogranin-A-like n=1 Tax=Pristis pectinata TaxID=685728 RepID=UPI00223D69B5|nr:chromogranin-A-like [Pristis pectinata]